jgi:hypothetical protein
MGHEVIEEFSPEYLKEKYNEEDYSEEKFPSSVQTQLNFDKILNSYLKFHTLYQFGYDEKNKTIYNYIKPYGHKNLLINGKSLKFKIKIK